MLRSFRSLALLSPAIALSGCIIYATPEPAPGPRAVSSRPAPRPSRSGRAPAPQPSLPEQRPQSSAPPPSRDIAPRITAPTLFGNGTGGAFQGHAYVLPEGTRTLPNFDQLVPFATLFTDSFNVTPQPFTGGFPGALRQDDWFGIRYEGAFLAPVNTVYAFELTSDDGAALYIDGLKVVTTDGLHAPVTAVGRKDLRRGEHLVRLDYFQGARGGVALTVSVIANGQKTLLTGVRR